MWRKNKVTETNFSEYPKFDYPVYYGIAVLCMVGVGNLARNEGIITAEGYIDILCENLKGSLLKLNLENNYLPTK